MTSSSEIVGRLEEIKLEVNKSISDRIAWQWINSIAEAENREPDKEGGIYPSPYVNPKTGYLEWCWHILVRKQDLDAQLEYLKALLREIDNRISFFQELDDDRSESVKQGLLIDIVIKAHVMGIASRGELQGLYSEEYPGRALAEDKMLQMFEQVNKL
jgi:hypothetical protein